MREEDNEAEKPNREPDLVIPAEESAREVALYVEENVFHFTDNPEENYKRITSQSKEFYNVMDYIRAVANNGFHRPNRAKVAAEYLMTLELERLVFDE